ncbi:hypothetical protein CWI42_060530 [Ordospora colligata]|nr:hypothetical protein CWI42_060530 [Ordospora colligata]
MQKIDVDEIARKASFFVKERSVAHGMQMPKEFSRICSVNGHLAIVYGTTLFIDGVKVEEDVVYLSKDGEKVVATKKNGVIVYDFLNKEVLRISTVDELRRCEIWNEWIGLLTEDGILYVYNNGKFSSEYDDVRDFVLPDAVVRSDRRYMGHEGVQRVFRSHDGEIIVVCMDKLVCGKSEVANGISTGDIEYNREWNECHYYYCDFHGANILSSSKSSKILLLDMDLCELDMEEEIRFLVLRTNEMFDVRYLTGIDYLAGLVFMIDEDGVLSKFEVVGIDCEKINECSVSINEEHVMNKLVERKYNLCKEEGMQKTDTSNAVNEKSIDKEVDSACTGANLKSDRMFSMSDMMNAACEDKKKVQEFSMSDMMSAACEDKDNIQERVVCKSDVSIEMDMKAKPEHNNKHQINSTGNPKIDNLVKSLSAQVDAVIEDFRNICVDKKTFKMYKYNANDLSLFTEQVYKNIMRLEEYKSMQQQISEKLSQMQGSLETYEAMDEENIKSAVKYIDSVIDSMDNREGKKIVHYSKPLLHTISHAKTVRLELDINAIKIGKGLSDVEHTESKMQDIHKRIPANQQIDKEHNKKQTDSQETPELVNTPKECINTMNDSKSDTQTNNEAKLEVNCSNENPKEREYAHVTVDTTNYQLDNVTTTQELPEIQKPLVNMPQQHTNIFGQPVSQQQQTVQFGMIGNAMPSSIFESLASNVTSIPVSTVKNQEEPSQETPNAFLRFANTRNLF